MFVCVCALYIHTHSQSCITQILCVCMYIHMHAYTFTYTYVYPRRSACILHTNIHCPVSCRTASDHVCDGIYMRVHACPRVHPHNIKYTQTCITQNCFRVKMSSHTCVSTHVRSVALLHIRKLTLMNLYIGRELCMSVYVYTYTYVYIHTYMRVCMHACMLSRTYRNACIWGHKSDCVWINQTGIYI